jgi:deazaflavin-dependent oxidoreductase (nitroreductase family)
MLASRYQLREHIFARRHIWRDRHDHAVEGTQGATPHFQQPGWFTRNVFNRAVAAATHLGISVWGSRVLEVRGRRSGTLHQTPVNVLTLGDSRYLVAPRGHTQWVRNLRAAGEGDLLLGSRREGFKATEVADPDKEPILRAYLRRWKWEVGQFFAGVGPDSPASDLIGIAPDHPVFRIETRS